MCRNHEAGLAIPYPTLMAPENLRASCVITGHLSTALRGQEEFKTVDQSAFIREGREELRKWSARWSEEALADTLEGALVQFSRHLWRATNTGMWLTVKPLTVNGTELGAQEWQNTLFLRYGINPPGPPKFCDGCNSAFSILHALDCKKGGLVMERHNKLCDRVADLSGKAFTLTHVRDDPLIFTGCAVLSPKTHPAGTTPSP